MRLARLAVPLPCLVPALLAGCTSGAKHVPVWKGEAGATSAGADARALPTSAPVFSAPIGAARIGRIDVVAGLVVAEGIVRAAGFAGGAIVWTADALRGVAWTPDAEIRLQPASGGVAVFWKGLRDGKPVRTLVLLGPRGEPRGEPIEIGAAFCGTTEGLAWIAPRAAGPTRVRARRGSEPEARDVVTLAPDRDPALVCGDHGVIVLGDGDDDLTASMFVPGDASAHASAVAMRDTDFADDEREHDAYSIGDDLGLVRVGASGAVAMREVLRGGAPGPWRKLKHVLSTDDDVVTVDGDATSTFIVVTHDADDACTDAGATAESVRAIRVERKTGEESLVELAAGDCDHARGPFWIATGPAGPVVAWVERRTALPPKTAPVDAMAFRVLRAGGVVAGRIEQQADALVDAGCDESGCSVAALVREPGTDGMRPAPIRVFGYP
ncbi:MAG TPA: hypothetical protein VN894_00065 [Polyangiaceae bacterium]|nr:hypothetical protein [Polyangiaceae bacterium]